MDMNAVLIYGAVIMAFIMIMAGVETFQKHETHKYELCLKSNGSYQNGNCIRKD